MPRLKQKKSEKHMAAFRANSIKRWNQSSTPSTAAEAIATEENVENRTEENEVEMAEEWNGEEFVCRMATENGDDTFWIGKTDTNYYYDSFNESDNEDETWNHYIPHALPYGRKHTKLFEIVDSDIQFVRYNGDSTDVKQIVVIPYFKNGHHTKSTVGFTHHINIRTFSSKAHFDAHSGLQYPRLSNTRGFRSVRDAQLATDRMGVKEAFPTFLFARGALLANKLKGIVRRAMKCQFVFNAPDCTNAFRPHIPMILQKLAGVSKFMMPQERQNIFEYADRKGYQILPAAGFFGPKVVAK